MNRAKRPTVNWLRSWNGLVMLAAEYNITQEDLDCLTGETRLELRNMSIEDCRAFLEEYAKRKTA